jgi:hypothetical protein
MFKAITRSDVCHGLTAQEDIYNYWGDLVVKKGSLIPNLQTEINLTNHPHWIWTANSQPLTPPCDLIQLQHPAQELEYKIESLRRLTQKTKLPQNFLSIIWRHANYITNLNKTFAAHPVSCSQIYANPSNALRNAYSTSILVEKICRAQHLPEIETTSIVSASLTMNWPIFVTQDKLNSFKSAPSRDQIKTIIEHPTSAANLLKSMGLTNQQWLTSVEQHHEEPDGKGYPKKLIDAEIYIGAKIIRLCDRYIAMTSARRHRQPMLTKDALKSINELISDQAIKKSLIDELGDYPPGSYWRDHKNGHIWYSISPQKTSTSILVNLITFETSSSSHLTLEETIIDPSHDRHPSKHATQIYCRL